MAQRSTTWYLSVRKGPKAGSAYPLPAGTTITLGRHADNLIVIDDPMASRHHARLTWRGNTFLVEDLGSANGTWVNNVRITSPVSLQAGDVIGLSQEVLLVFSDRPQADETVYDASARPGAVPVAVPPSLPATAPAAGKSQGWLAFSLGGVMAILAIVALAAVGLAAYLLLRKAPETPELVALPTSTFTPVPTATPYPTYTPVPTEVPTSTPYPTYTPVPTEVPTSTPYPTYTPVPTEVPTSTPYPTYTPFPTATPRPRSSQPQSQPPTNTPIPTATTLSAPYTVTLGRNVTYEPWGRPLDPGGCKGPYDDESPVRRFTVEIILTNNSNRFIPDHWSPVFISASGRPLPTCIWYYNNTVVQPGEIINVTFATHLESNDWVTAIVFDELGYTLATCLSPSGQMVPCQ